MTVIYSIISFILILLPLVILHEFGHYFSAKFFKIKVLEFGFGFPPKLFSIWSSKKLIYFEKSIDNLESLLNTKIFISTEFKNGKEFIKEIYLDRKSSFASENESYEVKVNHVHDNYIQVKEMQWSFNLLPLGGFVRPFGEDDSSHPDSFYVKNAFQRFVVLVSGVAINLLLPFVIFFFTSLLISEEIKSDLIIVDVSKESPAFNSGLKAGDKVVGINNDKIYNMNDLQRVLTSNLGKSIEITVDRGVPNPFAKSWEQNFEYNQNILNFIATPRWNPPEGEGALGISISVEKSEIIQVENGIIKSINNSYESVAQLISLSINSIKAIFNKSTNPQFSGPVAVGPVGISQITGSVASSDLTLNSKIKVYAELISILSLSLGVINLLPIPALDGGRILFVLIEILRGGRKVPPDKERIVHSLGFMVMIFLLILVTFQDISRIFNSPNIVG
ncbi:MAG: M50 family metallopeptidase [Chloroflexota bacterium]|nr:M50 family metallopeptidase [Chloroflexota bacterium]